MAARRTKRTDGRYSVTLTVESFDGEKRRLYFYGRTQAEAKGKAKAARERLAVGAPVRDSTRSVSDWLDEWRATFLLASDPGGLDEEPVRRPDPAPLTDVSNAYLSQLERGLHQPSIRVVRSIADASNISAETLLEQAGMDSDRLVADEDATEAASGQMCAIPNLRSGPCLAFTEVMSKATIRPASDES